MNPRLQLRRYNQNRTIMARINDEDLENPAFHFFSEIPGKEAFELHFRCECARARCNARLPVNLSQFRRIHRYKNRFVVHPDHVFPEIETVQQRQKEYVVVEKKPGYRPRDLVSAKSGDSSPDPS